MMKRAKGATLPEIMKTTGWQPHTARGFVSILGSKGGENRVVQRTQANGRTGSRNRAGNSSSECSLGHAPATIAPLLQRHRLSYLEQALEPSSDST